VLAFSDVVLRFVVVLGFQPVFDGLSLRDHGLVALGIVQIGEVHEILVFELLRVTAVGEFEVLVLAVGFRLQDGPSTT